jgi:CRP-like cAMP-binding protein
MYKKADNSFKQRYSTSADAIELLLGSALFSGFTEAELIDAFPVLQPVFRSYGRDNIIIDEGDAADHIGFVASGRIVARKMTNSGRIHILAVHEAGDDFGFDAAFTSHKSSPLTFTAETECTVLFITTQCFFDQSTLGVRIVYNANHILADKCVRLLYKTDVLSRQSLRDKIMTFFCIMQKKNQSESFYLRMSREQFAQYLCVNRSALSRELSRMQNEGLIELKPDGRVYIKSLK